jgi:hypothetical protein
MIGGPDDGDPIQVLQTGSGERGEKSEQVRNIPPDFRKKRGKEPKELVRRLVTERNNVR